MDRIDEATLTGLREFYGDPDLEWGDFETDGIDRRELGAVRIDDAMIQRGCDAYSAKRMEETGEGESYPEGVQAALTAALQHRGDSRGGEG